VKEKNIFKMDYYKTYYFSNICNEIIENPLNYIRHLDEFWGNGQISYLLNSFQKYSVLHHFIEHVIDRLFCESNNNYFPKLNIEELQNHKFWINDTLNYHDIKHPSFNDWYSSEPLSEDLIFEYLEFIEYSDFYLDLKEQMIEETFFILFMNRNFLRKFNLNISGIFRMLENDECNNDATYLLNDKGKLLRKNIPSWAKKAVFFRDRGTCTYCKKDLSGLINISNNYHIDHIIPLAKYGFNDISNLQLLCEFCNTSKGSRHTNVSNEYEKWY